MARNLDIPIAEMGLNIRAETRTGDTSMSKRQRQRRDPPDILLTTPEQLALLLASADRAFLFADLKRVIIDELHSLTASKRGDVLSLDLARLRDIAPQMRTTGLSATVRDPDELRRWLVSQSQDRMAHLVTTPPARHAGYFDPRYDRTPALVRPYDTPRDRRGLPPHQNRAYESRLRQYACAC